MRVLIIQSMSLCTDYRMSAEWGPGRDPSQVIFQLRLGLSSLQCYKQKCTTRAREDTFQGSANTWIIQMTVHSASFRGHPLWAEAVYSVSSLFWLSSGSLVELILTRGKQIKKKKKDPGLLVVVWRQKHQCFFKARVTSSAQPGSSWPSICDHNYVQYI